MNQPVTESLSDFAQNAGMIDFLMIYLLKAQHPDPDVIKNDLIKSYDESQKNEYKNDYIKEFLKSSDSNLIFDYKEYEEFFGQMAYSRLVDNCLCYFKDVLVEIVKVKPQLLKSKEKEELNYILSFDSMGELINDLTEKKINELFYLGVKDIESFFETRLNIKLFETDENRNEFNKLVKQRNIIVHNRGIISKDFARSFPEFKKHIGMRLFFSYDRLSKINWFISKLLFEIDFKLSTKYSLKTEVLI